MNSVEWLGLLGSFVILFGLAFTDIIKLRLLNILGSFIFMIYGISIGSLSVWILNLACIIQNVYKLIKLKKG